MRLASGDHPMFQRRPEPDTSVRRKSRSPPSRARHLRERADRGDNSNVTMNAVAQDSISKRRDSRSSTVRSNSPSTSRVAHVAAQQVFPIDDGLSSSPQCLAGVIGVTSSLSALVSARRETGAGDGSRCPSWWRGLDRDHVRTLADSREAGAEQERSLDEAAWSSGTAVAPAARAARARKMGRTPDVATGSPP